RIISKSLGLISGQRPFRSPTEYVQFKLRSPVERIDLIGETGGLVVLIPRYLIQRIGYSHQPALGVKLEGCCQTRLIGDGDPPVQRIVNVGHARARAADDR